MSNGQNGWPKRKSASEWNDSGSARTTDRGRRRSMWPITVRVPPSKRVRCKVCRASHPAIYEGESCLICGSILQAAAEHPESAGVSELKKRNAKDAEQEYQAKIAALRSERDELRTALEAVQTRQGPIGAPDYEWHVELAAKGLAQRDSYPMPPSVTEPKEFYEIMAGAALDATGLPFLLERIVKAERSLEIIQDALKQADVKVENARHLARTDPLVSIAGIAPTDTATRASKPRPTPSARRSEGTATKRKRRLSETYRDVVSRLARRPAKRPAVVPRPKL